MSKTISIFIPVYRESKLLSTILNDLLNDPYKDKEIFVIIDEPTNKCLEDVLNYENKVEFILNSQRKGKVEALNSAVERSKGELLLFLDADVKLANSPNFLRNLWDEAEEADLIEIKKKIVRTSFISKLVSYDYMSFNFVNWIFSRTIKRCLGVNGAAFAVKRASFEEVGGFRRVMSEDLDLGIRAFLQEKTFKYVDSVEVLNEAPSTFGEWFRQRKRWATGAALWVKDYYGALIRSIVNHPQLLTASILLLFPSLPLLATSFLLSQPPAYQLFTVFLTVLATRISVFIPILSLAPVGFVFLKHTIVSLVSVAFSALLFNLISRKLGYEFNTLEFVAYFLIYNPLWILILLIAFIKVFIFSNNSVDDWKV